MTCSTVLDQILEADLDVLDGTGDSDVARHVRACARCQAIARQIVGDTRSLAVRVDDARTTIRLVTRRNRAFVVAAGLAAVLSVVVVREWQRRESVPRNASRVATVDRQTVDVAKLSEPTAPAVAARLPEPRLVRPSTHQRSATQAPDAPTQPVRATPLVLATVAERTIVKPVDSPVAVAPVRIDTTSSIALGGGVTVDPPAGTRANIIRTPNPTVTVVWLYQ